MNRFGKLWILASLEMKSGRKKDGKLDFAAIRGSWFVLAEFYSRKARS